MRFWQYEMILFGISDVETHGKYVCQFSHFMLKRIFTKY